MIRWTGVRPAPHSACSDDAACRRCDLEMRRDTCFPFLGAAKIAENGGAHGYRP
jgi:hypothetical protein